MQFSPTVHIFDLTMANVIYLLLFLLQSVQSDEIFKKFGTKTPYRFVENDNLDVGPYPGCNAAKIYMTVRHGTRYPNEGTIKLMKNKLPIIKNEIINNHMQSRGHLSDEQILQLQKWNPINIPGNNEKYLTIEGQDEMIKLGKRMQIRFNKTIPLLYDIKKFQFKYTPTERAFESAKYFAAGIFENNTNVFFNETQKSDPVLRFYKSCKNWKVNVKKNPQTYNELSLYLNSSDVRTVMKNISNIFGYETDMNINIGRLLYVACSFETAWTKDYTSPWCYPFSEHGIKIMEYAEDLKYYWMDGYGYDINQRLACTVVKDVLNFFSDEEKMQAAFHFTHSGTLLMTMAHLGLHRDVNHLTHSNRDPNRKWQTSLIDGFGTNIGFVLYRCGDGDKILLLHQERPVRFPECPDEDLCPLTNIVEARINTLLACDLQQMCDMQFMHEEL